MESKPRKIVWMSRHAPTQSQLNELERIWPGHDLHINPVAFEDALDIAKRYHDMGGEEMVVVAPWTVIRELIRHGIRPIYAEMARVPLDKAEVVLGNESRRRGYKFVRFHYCDGVSLRLTPIAPKAAAAAEVAAAKEATKV